MPITQHAATTNVCRSEYQLHVWSLSANELSDTPRKVQVLAEKLHAYLGKVSFISKFTFLNSLKLLPRTNIQVEQHRTSQGVQLPKLSKWNILVSVSVV